MSGLNTASGSQENSVGDDLDMDTLTTGLKNLDQVFERKGIRMGSLVTVESEPDSPGDVLVANMVANRPTYYYTLGKSESHIFNNIEAIPNVNVDQITIEQVGDENPVETLRTVFKQTDFPRGSTIIFDPVNVLEQNDQVTYRSFLQELEKNVRKADAIGVLHAVKQDTAPETRWLTKYISDTVLEVMHRVSDESIKDYVAVQKVYAGQEIINDDDRVFELSTSLDLDIASSRNISP